MTAALLEIALAAHTAGLSVVPPRMDGSKRPLPDQWRSFQQTRPDPDLIRSWYSNGLTGIGAVTGMVSGGMEAFEFEDEETYQHGKDVADEAGLGPIIARLESGYVEASPSGGRHWLYRCSEIAGNTKLATRPDGTDEHGRPKVKTLIETRGEGGFIILAPSNGKVHPTGRAYRLLGGGFDTIPTLSPEERRDLFALARTFHVPDPAKIRDPAPRPADGGERPGERPGDAFNARARWADLLEPYGWIRLYERDGTTYWRRPGKSAGVSAATNWQGRDYLFVWSSSTPFDTETPYSKFAAYAVLEHAGDLKAAARHLGGQGYGDPKASKPRGERAGTESAPEPSAEPQRANAGITGTDLLAVRFPELKFLLPDILPDEGAFLFSGKPKLGKSWWALALALAREQGGKFLGRDVPKGKVVYLGLEDSPRRMQSRILTLQPDAKSLHGIRFFHSDDKVPRIGSGFERFMEPHLDGVSLIVIDIFQKIRPLSRSGNVYADDYAAMGALQEFATKFHLCVLALHHTRKEASEDVHDSISGSGGLAGAADGSIILSRKRGDSTAILSTTGRDMPESEHGLSFKDGVWSYSGTAEEIRASAEQNEIAAMVNGRSSGMTVQMICEATDKKEPNVRKLLRKLMDSGRIQRIDTKPAPLYIPCSPPPVVTTPFNDEER